MSDDEAPEGEIQRQNQLSAIHHACMEISNTHTHRKPVKVSRSALAVLSRTLHEVIESSAKDMILFAQHAKRGTVTSADVLLCSRKSTELHKDLELFVEANSTTKGKRKKAEDKEGNKKQRNE